MVTTSGVICITEDLETLLNSAQLFVPLEVGPALADISECPGAMAAQPVSRTVIAAVDTGRKLKPPGKRWCRTIADFTLVGFNFLNSYLIKCTDAFFC